MWDKRADMVVHQHEPFNAEPPRTVLAQHACTAQEAFYVRNHGPVPDVHPESWRLRVRGRVHAPLDLSLTDLRNDFEHHELVATLQCAGNRRAGLLQVRDVPGEAPWGPGATSTARWSGVRLADVLNSAGAASDASHVAFAAPDVSQIAVPPQRFGGSIPASKARSGEVLLAWAMNDEPLPAVHGAPVRVVVPGYIGARSVKWVDEITVRNLPSDNYFRATAYRLLPPEADPDRAGHGDGLALGPVALNSDILAPADGAHVPAGPTVVSGYALAGNDRGIARVDFSLDEGRTWHQATLDEPSGPWSWRIWRSTVELPANKRVSLTARAWDTTAATQPATPEELWNPKGYVNNSWARVHITTEAG